MSAVVQSVADIVNLSLVRIGYKKSIGNLYDGSEASRVALRIYGQTRDALIRDGDWDFAERNIAMTLLKQAPANGYVPPVVWSSAYPPIPWFFEYAYPADCLKDRAVKGTPLVLPNFDPQPNVYSVDNDTAFNPAQRVILCNVPNALLVYAGQVTDPTTMSVDFIELLAAALGRRLAPALTSLQTAQMEGADEKVSAEEAGMEQG
jgi:hypothetical protein